MLKFPLLLLFLRYESVLGQVCSNSSDIQCFCKQTTDRTTHLPVQIADCSTMQIEDIPDQLENHVNILDLTANDIQVLDPKRHKLSSKSLHVLLLKLNNIDHIDSEFFLAVPNLVELDLSYNELTTIDDSQVFQNLNQLRTLDLSYNNIKTLPDDLFKPLSSIQSLYLSYNNFGDVFGRSKNALTQTLGLSSDLAHLSLDGLNISKLHNAFFDDLNNLTSLHLADNEIEVVPNVPYSLERLDLSGNKLTFVSAKYLNYPSLKALRLDRMPSLTSIHHYAFYNLYALEELSISDCPNLREFNELAFDVASKDTSHHHLKSLSIARNGLTTLDESYKYFFRNMDKVDLRYNPWMCDCGILWIQDFASILYKSHEVTCNYNSYGPKKLLELNHKDLQECHPEIYGKKSHRVLIVVLSCAVVVLCGLIFYLLRYPLNFVSKKQVIGPNSPYNLASTSEEI